MTEQDINTICWWIPFKKTRNALRNILTRVYGITENVALLKENVGEVKTKLNYIQSIVDNKKNIARFSGHYEYWRSKRIVAIVEHYGEAFFQEKKVLELGCGYGDIGKILISLGANVIFCEGLKEHCDILRERFPNNLVYQVDLENEWPFSDSEHFDLILHLGLLYHLDNMNFSLEKCAKSTDNLVLETEVCDSDDPDFFIKVNEDGYDKSLTKLGTCPSAEFVEKILKLLKFKFHRISDTRCNALFHKYDWEVENTKTWLAGLRRFWFCEKEN